MTDSQPNNPLHGVTLEALLTELVKRYGWVEMGRRVNIRCFNSDPTIQSSLTFLRKTRWARKKVEDLYLSGGHGMRTGHKTKRRRQVTSQAIDTGVKRTRSASPRR